MSRLTNVIEAVKASRLGENRAWIYDENGNISDEVICGDVIPFLEELKEYEIEKSDEFIEDFIKDADNFYTYNYGCAIDKDISAWYKNDNPIMIVCVHLFGDARWGFSDYFVIEMNDYYDGTPLTQFLQLESVYQTVDIDDRYYADINIFQEEYDISMEWVGGFDGFICLRWIAIKEAICMLFGRFFNCSKTIRWSKCFRRVRALPMGFCNEGKKEWDGFC